MNSFSPSWIQRTKSRLKLRLGIPGTLSNVDILLALQRGEISIEPYESRLLGSAGYTYRLGDELLVGKETQIYNAVKNGDQSGHDTIDLKGLSINGLDSKEWVERYLPEPKLREHGLSVGEVVNKAISSETGLCHGYPFFPGDFALGSTIEALSLGLNYKVKVDGRSSAARRGMTFHQTAMNICPGHGLEKPTTVTLELKNTGPILWILHYGYLAGNFVWERTVSPTSAPYQGRYRDQGDKPGAPVCLESDILLP